MLVCHASHDMSSAIFVFVFGVVIVWMYRPDSLCFTSLLLHNMYAMYAFICMYLYLCMQCKVLFSESFFSFICHSAMFHSPFHIISHVLFLLFCIIVDCSLHAIPFLHRQALGEYLRASTMIHIFLVVLDGLEELLLGQQSRCARGQMTIATDSGEPATWLHPSSKNGAPRNSAMEQINRDVPANQNKSNSQGQAPRLQNPKKRICRSLFTTSKYCTTSRD